MDEPIDTVHARLKKAMGIRNKKASDLERLTGIPKSSISQYMSGYAKPKQDRIALLSKALNVNPAWLIGYDVSFELTNNQSTVPKEDVDHILNGIKSNPKLLELNKKALRLKPQDLDQVIRIVDTFVQKE